ncbi:MAG: hypothetical protein GWN89_15565, partial [Thermoplasmata archaeon]|nr:hypothetical protein [Thermoplasmata archaeon]NIT76447.1 hypothetical protein [Thermoplasmata archaeon]NIY02818.1 hypothetical protein [Thermoplasmata archaeon]
MGICNDTYGQGTYIKAKELGDDDVEVQIAGVTMEESFGREQVTLTIGEGDDARKLSLNKTNCNVLSDNFGDADSIEELDRLWTGKSIILYAIDTQTPDGVAT